MNYTLKKKKNNQRAIGGTALAVLCFGVGIWLFTLRNSMQKPIPIFITLLPWLLFLLGLVGIIASRKSLLKNDSYTYNETQIIHQNTNESYNWKDFSDIYTYAVNLDNGKFGGLAFRKSTSDTWLNFEGVFYDYEHQERMLELSTKARTKEALYLINNGQTLMFSYIPFTQGLKANFTTAHLNVKTDPIYLNKDEVTFQNKKYHVKDLQAIDKETKTFINGRTYRLLTKSNDKILDFEKFTLMSCEVFRNVINELAK